jgi:hypothetical protein
MLYALAAQQYMFPHNIVGTDSIVLDDSLQQTLVVKL